MPATTPMREQAPFGTSPSSADLPVACVGGGNVA